MNINFLRNNLIIRKLICKYEYNRADNILKKIYKHLGKKSKIIDIGAGTCLLSEAIQQKGHVVKSIDVQDLNFSKKIKLTLYDGDTLPFKKNAFNVSLLIFVLHHISNPIKTLKEANRVSKQIIIMDDIYTSKLSKNYTHFVDDLQNMFLEKNPHTNKSDNEWKKTFKDLGLILKHAEYYKSKINIQHAIYYLESTS